jgi:hypothetical protein
MLITRYDNKFSRMSRRSLICEFLAYYSRFYGGRAHSIIPIFAPTPPAIKMRSNVLKPVETGLRFVANRPRLKCGLICQNLLKQVGMSISNPVHSSGLFLLARDLSAGGCGFTPISVRVDAIAFLSKN